jgi:hypothetical protein
LPYLVIIFLLNFSLVFATTFARQPVEQQIKESDGILLGHYLKKKTVILEDGKVATQMIFKINKEYGLQSDYLGGEDLIIHYPGGTLPQGGVQVDGVPKFSPGEKAVIFVKNISNRYWGMNLGFGTYKLLKYGKRNIMVNYIFPTDPQVGQVTLEKFEKSVKEIKGSGLKVVQNIHSLGPSGKEMRAPASLPKEAIVEGQNRSIASKNEQEENQSQQSTSNMFWLIATLGVIGGIFRLRKT